MSDWSMIRKNGNRFSEKIMLAGRHAETVGFADASQPG